MTLKDDPLWYKDAIIYELHVKAYRDGSGDGIGDFEGLISKLDYLQNLGITAIWLLPFYPSPLRDDGYDIADYQNVHSVYGSLSDFKEFLKQAHKRGMYVITELVLNHTSDQHAWFQKSRRANPGSTWRNAYVWSETPDKYKEARIIFQDFESSNWTWDPIAKAYYWHRFYSHQPDLNYDNAKVHKTILNVIDFWLNMGVDGLRLDAVPYLYEREGTNCENLPETHKFLKKLRSYVDERFKNKMLLAEANQWPEDAALYFGDGNECHMGFNFPIMPRMFMAMQMEDRFPIIDILDPPLGIPETCQWALFLRNHDELTLEMVTDEERDYMYRVYAQDPRIKINLGIRRRLAPLLGNNRRRIELMNFLLFSLPGTPILYYGDEIGMGDNYYLGDRDGVRTPMQWSPDRNAGFSKANPQQLYLPVIIDPDYHYEAVNVENQERNVSSLLWWMKRVIAMRKRFKALSRGSIQFLTPHNTRILAFIRQYKDETILCVANLSRFSQADELDLAQYAGNIPEEVFSYNRFPAIRKAPYVLTFGPHNYYWFLLRKEKEVFKLKKEKALPQIAVKTAVKEVFEAEPMEKFEQEVLIPYLKGSRWFGGKGRAIRRISILENAPITSLNTTPSYILILEVTYNEGVPEVYLLPVSFLKKDEARVIQQQFPQGVVAEIKIGNEEGILCDSVYNKDFHRVLFKMIAEKKRLAGKNGRFISYPIKTFKTYLKDKILPLESSILTVEQSNSSILYENIFILKLFRKLEKGLNPDTEIVKALTEKARFPHIPAFAGAIEYHKQGSEPVVIGFMQNFMPNQGDAWGFALDNVGKYFESILSKRAELEGTPEVIPFTFDKDASKANPLVEELIGTFYLEMVTLLGQRTAELHITLSSLSDDPAFAPEHFSTLYQRSVYQSMRTMARSVFHLLDENIRRCPKKIRNEVSEIATAQPDILKRFAQVLGKKISTTKIRIHGDYHLGQVLFTGKDFVIIDFEGEPARALSERRLKRSPLRDVAGMIRSFHYAAYAGLLKHPLVNEENRPFLEPWVRVWYHYVSHKFLRSYLDTATDAPFLPRTREELTILLEAFLLEKAVYELGYELNNRPDWVSIPIRGIRYILESAGK